MPLFGDGPDWKTLYLEEREEVRRLTRVIEKMRKAGFNTVEPARVVVAKSVEQKAVEREEETVIRPIMERLRAERPDLPESVLLDEARGLYLNATGGTV